MNSDNKELDAQPETSQFELCQIAHAKYRAAFLRDLQRSKQVDPVSLALDHALMGVYVRAMMQVFSNNGVNLDPVYEEAAKLLEGMAAAFDKNAILIPH